VAAIKAVKFAMIFVVRLFLNEARCAEIDFALSTFPTDSAYFFHGAIDIIARDFKVLYTHCSIVYDLFQQQKTN